MDNGDGDNNDEWETDSADSQPDRTSKEKRKHGKLRHDSDSSNRRAPGSRGCNCSRHSPFHGENGEKSPGGPVPPTEDNDTKPPGLESDTDHSEGHDNGRDSNLDGSESENEEDNDVVVKTPPTPATLLIEPLPAVPLHLALPGLLLTREFSGLTTYASPALTRQKLAGHRDMVQRMALWAKLEHHTGCVNALNFNPSGTLLASGSDDLKVNLWDWSRKKLKYTFESGHTMNVFQSKFMPLSNDSLIVTSSRDGRVRLAELSTAGGPPAIRTLCRHQRSCHKVDVRPDATHEILTCGEDAAVFHVDIRAGQAKKCLTVFNNTVEQDPVRLFSIMSNPHNSVQFAVAGADPFVRIYDLRKLNRNWKTEDQALSKLCPPIIRRSSKDFIVSSAVFNHNGSEILASYSDHNIFLFKNESSEESFTIQQYEGHRNSQTIKGVNFYGPRSEFVVSGSDCGTVFFWDTLTGRIVHYLTADEIGAVNVLEPHPMDPVFATSGLEHSVKVWAPIAESRPDLSPLVPIIQRNQRERSHDWTHGGAMDAHQHLFMMLMRQMGGLSPPQPRPNQSDPDEMPHSENNSDSSDEDSDGGHGMPGLNGRGCATS